MDIDQWSDYLNPNAGKVEGYDAKIDRGMSFQPDDPGMDQGIIGTLPSIGGSGGGDLDM